MKPKKLSQLVVRKTRTFVIPSEDLPEDLTVGSEEAWRLSETPRSKVVYEDCEVLAVEPADWTCTGCLADLEVRGSTANIKIIMADNGTRPTVSYDSIEDYTVECSEGCGERVDKDRQQRLLAEIL